MKKIALALSIACVAAAPAFAQESQPTVLPGEVTEVALVPDEVNANTIALGAPGGGFKSTLTTEQLEKLHAIRGKYADASGGKKAELSAASRQLRDLLTQPTVDRSQAAALQTKINQLKNDLSNIRLSMKLDSLEVFTPEQRKDMRERMLKREAFGHKFGGKRFHGHGKHGKFGGHGPR